MNNVINRSETFSSAGVISNWPNIDFPNRNGISEECVAAESYVKIQVSHVFILTPIDKDMQKK